MDNMKALLANVLAIELSLYEKGVLEHADVTRMRGFADKMIDKIWKEQQVKAEAQFEKKHPGWSGALEGMQKYLLEAVQKELADG